MEPADLWTTRMDQQFRDRAPRVESRPNGDYYLIDGFTLIPVGLEGVAIDDKIAGEIKSPEGYRHAATRPGVWDPQARQFWATFEDDRAGVLTRELIGVERLMWGSDYPHTEGTFPRSREQIATDFAGIPEAEVS